MSIPLQKKIDLGALGDLVKRNREDTLKIDQSPYVQMLGGGWTQSKLSQLENKRLNSLVWELAEALRLHLGALPLIDRDAPVKSAVRGHAKTLEAIAEKLPAATKTSAAKTRHG